MTDIILHHYEISPYSEKIRAILGFKRLRWSSVEQPMVMPKPDQVALTGGYRRAPVLQLGRDIYCDSRLIARVLDRLQPERPLVPASHAASCAAFQSLEPILFFAGVATAMQPAGLKSVAEEIGQPGLEAFFKDRAVMFNGRTTRPTAELGQLTFLPAMSALDAQLANRNFLLGDEPTLADFIVHNCVWFVHRNQGVAKVLAPFGNLLSWHRRIRDFGHGQRSELPAAQAIRIAQSASGDQSLDGPAVEPEGIKIGKRVRVQATDYACDPVEGMLVHVSTTEVVLERQDERAGQVRVHFPRSDFAISAA